MKKALKNLSLKLIPKIVSDFVYSNHPEYKKTRGSNPSFSQEGEDMLLRKIFAGQEKGIYVDIGAHHPINFSNTNFFSKKGWAGINVDPLPGSKKTFDLERVNDTNLELVVSEQEGMVEFYLFDPPLMNTMSKEQAEKNAKFDWCKLQEVKMIPSLPLHLLLDKYLTPNAQIDFMSIDVEGAEISVLKSNNWKKYKPNVLLIEFIDLSIEEIFQTDIHKLLVEHSYKLFAKTWNTVFYKQIGFFEF